MAYVEQYQEAYGAGEYAAASACAAVLSVAEEQQHLVAYAPLVKRIVRQLNSQVSGAIDRDDMEQIGLMGLLEALRRYGVPDQSFGSYASLRIRGAILDELRRQDWRPRAVRQESHRLRDSVRALLQESLGQADSAPSPEEQLMVRRSLEQALRTLDEREQRVIQMYYEFELSYKEIAAVLDLSDARVCQLNKTALGKMKAMLQDT